MLQDTLPPPARPHDDCCLALQQRLDAGCRGRVHQAEFICAGVPQGLPSIETASDWSQRAPACGTKHPAIRRASIANGGLTAPSIQSRPNATERRQFIDAVLGRRWPSRSSFDQNRPNRQGPLSRDQRRKIMRFIRQSCQRRPTGLSVALPAFAGELLSDEALPQGQTVSRAPDGCTGRQQSIRAAEAQESFVAGAGLRSCLGEHAWHGRTGRASADDCPGPPLSPPPRNPRSAPTEARPKGRSNGE